MVALELLVLVLTAISFYHSRLRNLDASSFPVRTASSNSKDGEMIDYRLKPRLEEKEAVVLVRKRTCVPSYPASTWPGMIRWPHSRCLARATCPCLLSISFTYTVQTWLPAQAKLPKHRPGYHTTPDMLNLAAARYQRSWTKRKLKSLSPFASRVQITILQGASKPFTTLRSLHALARLPPPSGHVNHRGTIGQGRGGSHSRRQPPAPRDVQHAYGLLKYSISVPWSQPSPRRNPRWTARWERGGGSFIRSRGRRLTVARQTLAVVVLYVVKLSRTFRVSQDTSTGSQSYEVEYETTEHAKQPASVARTFRQMRFLTSPGRTPSDMCVVPPPPPSDPSKA
ncbi:hypothetical protein MRX96_027056 [Rhipicephalus microplus]